MPEIATTTVDPMNANGLGITLCTSCGEPRTVVGDLDDDGNCRLCAHDLDRYDVLADELRALLTPAYRSWLASCRARGVTPYDIDVVLCMLTDHGYAIAAEATASA